MALMFKTVKGYHTPFRRDQRDWSSSTRKYLDRLTPSISCGGVNPKNVVSACKQSDNWTIHLPANLSTVTMPDDSKSTLIMRRVCRSVNYIVIEDSNDDTRCYFASYNADESDIARVAYDLTYDAWGTKINISIGGDISGMIPLRLGSNMIRAKQAVLSQLGGERRGETQPIIAKAWLDTPIGNPIAPIEDQTSDHYDLYIAARAVTKDGGIFLVQTDQAWGDIFSLLEQAAIIAQQNELAYINNNGETEIAVVTEYTDMWAFPVWCRGSGTSASLRYNNSVGWFTPITIAGNFEGKLSKEWSISRGGSDGAWETNGNINYNQWFGTRTTHFTIPRGYSDIPWRFSANFYVNKASAYPSMVFSNGEDYIDATQDFSLGITTQTNAIAKIQQTLQIIRGATNIGTAVGSAALTFASGGTAGALLGAVGGSLKAAGDMAVDAWVNQPKDQINLSSSCNAFFNAYWTYRAKNDDGSWTWKTFDGDMISLTRMRYDTDEQAAREFARLGAHVVTRPAEGEEIADVINLLGNFLQVSTCDVVQFDDVSFDMPYFDTSTDQQLRDILRKGARVWNDAQSNQYMTKAL